jgi:hypothetical protein
MKKRKILIVYPYVFRNFDYFRYEIKNLEKNFSAEVIVHEVIKIINPKFTNAYKNFYKSNKIYRFDSYFLWQKEFRCLVDNNPDLLIIKDIQSSNFFSFLVNLEIKKAQRKVLEYSGSPGHPPDPEFNIKKIRYSNLLNIKIIIFFLNARIYNILGNLFKLYPNYCLKAGSKGFRNIYKSSKVNIIKANTFDYSNYITYKKIIQKKSKKKIAIFLDSPVPFYDGDNLLIGINKQNLLTKKVWYKALNIFFRNIEKLLDIKIKICLHPKVESSQARYKYKNIFEGREILKKRPVYYLNNTELIISRHSTGFSYAVISKIPSLIITSNEILKDNKFINSQIFLSEELGTDIFNIDNDLDEKKITKFLKINKKKYRDYKTKYLTSLNTLKPNYKIIGETFL